MQKRLEKRSGWLPKLVMTGGDARPIAQALNAQAANTGTKQVIIIENLVLQGLVLLNKEIPDKEIPDWKYKRKNDKHEKHKLGKY